MQHRIAYRMPASRQPGHAVLAVRERRPRPASSPRTIAAREARHEQRRVAAPGTVTVKGIESAAGCLDSTVPAAATPATKRPAHLLHRVAQRREARRSEAAAVAEEEAAAPSSCASFSAAWELPPHPAPSPRPSLPSGRPSPHPARCSAERETRCRTAGSDRAGLRSHRARRRRQGIQDIRRELPWGPRSSGVVDRAVVGCPSTKHQSYHAPERETIEREPRFGRAIGSVNS